MRTMSNGALSRFNPVQPGAQGMKVVATGLLVVMAAVFAVARAVEPSYPWLAYVKAFAEAAMVGGLADWFAVTALFRHPLGLPIPHTAIIPANKDRIGRALGVFLQQNFLSPALVTTRLRDAAPSRRLGAWLVEPTNARRASETAATLVAGLPDLLDDDAISGAVRQTIIERVRAVPAAPLLARGLEIGIEEGQHRVVVDAVLARAGDYLEENRDALYARLRTESPWWVPGIADERVFGKV